MKYESHNKAEWIQITKQMEKARAEGELPQAFAARLKFSFSTWKRALWKYQIQTTLVRPHGPRGSYKKPPAAPSFIELPQSNQSDITIKLPNGYSIAVSNAEQLKIVLNALKES